MAAQLTGADLWRAQLDGANLEEATLAGADLRWADLTNARWYLAYHPDIRINADTEFGATVSRKFGKYVPLNPKHPLHKRLSEKHTRWSQYELDARNTAWYELWEKKDSLEKAAWTYRQLESLHQENAMVDEAREYNFRRGQADRKRYRVTFHPVKWLVATAHRYLTGYGNRFSWIVAWIFVTLLGSTVLYLAFGYSTPAGPVRPIADPMSLQSWQAFIANPNWQVILESLQFSIATFGWGSVGDVEPLGYSAVVVTVESLLGGFLFGLFGFVLARRLP